MKEVIKAFAGRKILVIGDLMLDKYLFGDAEKISQEAPVPIVNIKREAFVLGGAANAANNISSLGGKAFLIGLVGNDPAKQLLIKKLNEANINSDNILTDNSRTTTQKIRVLAQNQQLLRIDYEERSKSSPHIVKNILKSIKEIEGLEGIVVSDYSKGVITEELLVGVKEYAKEKNLFIIVDPKPSNKNAYKNVFLITPNLKEAAEMSGKIIETTEDVNKVGDLLVKELGCKVLITRGKDGMSLFEEGKAPKHISTKAKEVYDVSGAGDTVIATLSLALSAGVNLESAVDLANHAAGVKVGKLGTAPVYAEELERSLE